jgi:hypothetical protein
LTLTGAPAATTTPATAFSGLTLPVLAFPVVNGTVTATYIVGTYGGGSGSVFSIPVFVTVGANLAPVQTAATVNVAYAPAAALTSGTLPSVIPQFAVSAAAATNTFSVTSCATTLLFPYVTNATGFETGLAVANTTTDNLPTASGKTFTSTPLNGTCTFNFYGSQATQPAAWPTPTLGVNTTAAPTINPVYANTLTAMTGATNFTGYAIALCTFQEAHGFAFITDLTGQFSGAMGYLAVVLPNGRNEAPTTTLTNQ